MAKKNDDFFVEKKPWSEVKDQLLGCYLKPYIAKILHTRKPLVYVDCFAGKGKFDDGKLGSPLIALDIMQQGLISSTMTGRLQIAPAFIDLNYADDLKVNLKDYPGVRIVSGAYEDTIDELLKNKSGCNVFLYIDPYGIKALNCSKFDEFANGQFNSIELLINMNSFGFIREGCRVMGKQFKMADDTFFDDLVEYEPTKLDASEKSIKALKIRIIYLLSCCVLFFIYGLTCIYYPTKLYHCYQIDIIYISPYISEQDIKILNSRWVSMNGKADYEAIYAKINQVKKENNLTRSLRK